MCWPPKKRLPLVMYWWIHGRIPLETLAQSPPKTGAPLKTVCLPLKHTHKYKHGLLWPRAVWAALIIAVNTTIIKNRPSSGTKQPTATVHTSQTNQLQLFMARVGRWWAGPEFCALGHTHTHTHTHPLAFSSHTHTVTHSHTHGQTHGRTHTVTHPHTHTHPHTRTHPHAHTHTHTHAQARVAAGGVGRPHPHHQRGGLPEVERGDHAHSDIQPGTCALSAHKYTII